MGSFSGARYDEVMQHLVGLNERQKEAVLATEGPFSILAGAGSGKTKVLTTRIYHLIRQGTPAERILAVTFTNKAAREMRERLAGLLGDGAVPFVATFHGLGRELLQQYGRAIGVPRYFSVYDRDDSERAIKEALKAMDIDPKEVPPRAILARISKAKGEGFTAHSFKQRHGGEGFRSRIASDTWLRYDETLQKEKALDFDDLIAKPVQLFEAHPDALRMAQERFS
jgi:DNA helicase-2/ATP-dependent DNA helicase PcrA